MRPCAVFCAVLLLAVLLAAPVHAAEPFDLPDRLYEESGAESLLQNLPEEVRSIFRAQGIAPDQMGSTDGMGIFHVLSEATQTEIQAPLRTLFLLFGLIVLSAAVAEYAPDSLRFAVCICGSAAAAGIFLPHLASLLKEVETVLKAGGAFLTASIPVYASLLSFSGSAAAGSTYGALTLTAANALSVLSTGMFLPLIRLFAGLAALSPVVSFDLGKLMNGLHKAAKWILVLAVTVFSGVLSMQTLITSETDVLTGKAAKLVASSTVPIVGSAMGDAIEAIAGSVSLVKSGAGAFGILASLVIFLPICAKAAVWLGVCLAGSFAAEVFSETRLSSFLDGCAASLRLLLAVVCSVGAVLVVSAAVVLCVRGAYA